MAIFQVGLHFSFQMGMVIVGLISAVSYRPRYGVTNLVTVAAYGQYRSPWAVGRSTRPLQNNSPLRSKLSRELSFFQGRRSLDHLLSAVDRQLEI